MSETDEASLRVFRRTWCFGSEEFRGKMLALTDGKLGDNHSGELRCETVEHKVERIIAEELSRLNSAEPTENQKGQARTWFISLDRNGLTASLAAYRASCAFNMPGRCTTC
jgi:hypothetical protein